MEGAEEGTVWDCGSHRYVLQKVVGNGAFGIVWRAQAEDGETVAIKKVRLDCVSMPSSTRQWVCQQDAY